MVSKKIHVRLASDDDRPAIYAIRHEVYARELAQHAENPQKQLFDALDRHNTYVVAVIDGEIAGFVSITSPRNGSYSVDKYLRRDEIPFVLDDRTWEVRILTVRPIHRGTLVATLLMYAALRWIEAHGAVRIIALGRREVRSIYIKGGLHPVGREFRSGAIDFVLMTGMVAAIRDQINESLLARMESAAEWEIAIPFRKPADCFHGGAFFDAIGDDFSRLDRSASIINADVLDAWFPPSPRVMAALQEYLPWLIRTSPPIGSEGLIRTIARTRGIDVDCVLPGSGSSTLIYLALREWLTSSSRVLLPQPTYGEYAHVLEKVIRCRVDRLVLPREKQYRLELPSATSGYDLIVLVNPNSPTGHHIPRKDLEAFLRTVPAQTLVWIDETYTDYVGADQSLETFAVTRENVVICKSMSKVYALSGARCAYLCASPHLLERLRAISPPWAVSLPAQVAAVAALQDPRYYIERYRETHELRAQLHRGLSALELDVIPGVANFLLCHLPYDQSPAELVTRCRKEGLFIRDASNMGASGAVRIAVKNAPTTARMLEILQSAIAGSRAGATSSFGSTARCVFATST